MRLGVVQAMLVWVVLSAVGGVIVALPDRGPRVVSMSEGHGPGVADLVGLAFVLLGWSIFLLALWRHRSAVTASPLPVALALLGSGGVVAWSVATDAGAWWALGAGVAVAVQVLVGLSAATPRT